MISDISILERLSLFRSPQAVQWAINPVSSGRSAVHQGLEVPARGAPVCRSKQAGMIVWRANAQEIHRVHSGFILQTLKRKPLAVSGRWREITQPAISRVPWSDPPLAKNMGRSESSVWNGEARPLKSSSVSSSSRGSETPRANTWQIDRPEYVGETNGDVAIAQLIPAKMLVAFSTACDPFSNEELSGMARSLASAGGQPDSTSA